MGKMRLSTGELTKIIKSSKEKSKQTIEEISGEEPRMRKIRFALRRKLDGKVEAYDEILELLKQNK